MVDNEWIKTKNTTRIMLYPAVILSISNINSNKGTYTHEEEVLSRGESFGRELRVIKCACRVCVFCFVLFCFLMAEDGREGGERVSGSSHGASL